MMSRAPRLGAAIIGGLALFLSQPGCVPPTAQDGPIVDIEVFGVSEVTVGSSITLYTHRTDQYGNGVSTGTVTWSSSNSAVATVGAQTGVVTGVQVGTVSIIASSGGVTGSKSIEVKTPPNSPVSSVTVSGPGSVQKYAQATFTAELKDFNGVVVFRPVAWTSSDPTKATIISATGVMTAVSEGVVTITGTAEGRQGTAQVTITQAPVNEVILSGPTSVQSGFTMSLTAETRDAQFQLLTGRTVTWSSSDVSKATVNNGLVAGVAVGTATITATSEGKSANRLITVTSAPSTVSVTGRVVDGTNQNGLAGATVSVLKLDGSGTLAFGVQTGADGSFTTGTFQQQGILVEAFKTGYVTGRIQITTPLNGNPASVEPLPLVPTSAAKGAISGVVRDARTGQPIAGASLALYNNVQTAPIAPATANGSGVYTFSDLNAGTYRVAATAPNYQLVERVGIAVGNNGVTGNQDLVLAPTGSSDIRIVLTWGQSPQDLDSHLTGPQGANRFHVYFANTGHFNDPPYAGLDVDDTFQYGPETISITQMSAGNYRYSVHDFDNRNNAASTALGNSGAIVRLYAAGSVFAFYVPQGTGNLWTVFELSGTLANPVIVRRDELSFIGPNSPIPAPEAISGGQAGGREGGTDAEVIGRAVWRAGGRKATKGRIY